ncbi:hypothetical protein B0919_03795 [Hymenobacter sp. CRA2]|nr:hypothetical protein B0919_03795 [Hymenobacter sp. CRA2]
MGIGTTTPVASAALEVRSTSQGLLLPRLTTAQMNAISGAVPGLQIFNTTDSKFYGCTAAAVSGSVVQNVSSQTLNGGFPTFELAQSFVPTGSGVWQSVTVYSGRTGSSTVSVKLYSSNSPTGTPRGTTTPQTLNLVAGQPFTISVASLGVFLASGQPYSFSVTFGGSDVYLAGSGSDPYPNGQCYGVSGGFPFYDLKFQVDYGTPAVWVPLH